MITYTVKVIETIHHRPGWEELRVGVYRSDGDTEEQIGEYLRNYPELFNTFFHCSYGGKDYALYSPDYTVTRIMELPSCRDIGGEEPHSAGVCPVDLYVPQRDQVYCPFGFVAGCIWGDDSSWKIQYLDLSGIEKGIIMRDERFGYIELPAGVSLKQAIRLNTWPNPPDRLNDVFIAVERRFELSSGKLIERDPFA